MREAAERLGDDLKLLHEKAAGTPYGPQTACQVALVGWESEDATFPSAFISFSHGAEGVPPYAVMQIQGLLSPEVAGFDGATFDLQMHGNDLLRAHRRAHPAAIGGVMQLTSIFREMIVSEIVGDFGDQVGARLGAQA